MKPNDEMRGDTRFRYLERRAAAEVLSSDEAQEFLRICNRRWQMAPDGVDRGFGIEPLASIDQRTGRTPNFQALWVALNYLGSRMIEPFVQALNHELQISSIPFNPIGISATAGLKSAYTPAYWWAELKEQFPLHPALSDRVPRGAEGQIPGFQQGTLTMEYKLHPDNHVTLKINDVMTTSTINIWLGRNLEYLYSYENNTPEVTYDYPPPSASWVSQSEYDYRRRLMRSAIESAVHRVDPEIEVTWA